MSSETRTYRKLRPAWRGLFTASALFVDDDCLLLVRSFGYEEHVRRFYFKDIQAIVVSKARRFALSRWATIGALLLLAGIFIAPAVSPPIARVLFGIAGVLTLAWLYVSMRASCRCRLYTAVNQEELPSVRRQWIARRVLRELIPRIDAAQGTLPVDWRATLPPDRAVQLAQSASLEHGAAPLKAELPQERILASGALLLALLIDAILTSWDYSRTTPLPQWIGSLLALIEASCAVWVLIQNRGLNAGLQRLGAAVLIFLGAAFYAQFGLFGALQAQMKRQIDQSEMHSLPLYRTFLEIYIAACIVLFLMGAILTFAGRASQRGRLLVQ
jgi:hypothetical protein